MLLGSFDPGGEGATIRCDVRNPTVGVMPQEPCIFTIICVRTSRVATVSAWESGACWRCRLPSRFTARILWGLRRRGWYVVTDVAGQHRSHLQGSSSSFFLDRLKTWTSPPRKLEMSHICTSFPVWFKWVGWLVGLGWLVGWLVG